MSGRCSPFVRPLPGLLLVLVLVLVLVLSLIGGCASPRGSIALSPEFTREPKPVRVQLVLAEKQYTATALSTDSSSAHAAAAGAGQVGGIGAVVVGHLIAEAIIRGAEQGKDSRLPDPLVDFTRNLSIGDQYGRRLRATLEGSRWIRLTGMDIVSDRTDIVMPRSAGRQSADDAVMQIRTQYSFSTTYRQLYVETTVNLLPAGGGEPVYRATYRFCSPPIGGSDLEETLLLWAANDAARFGAMLEWGLQENLRMLRAAIADTNRDALSEPLEIERIAYTDRAGKTVELDAQLIEKTPRTRMFRVDGDHYVLARGDIPLAELDRHIATVGPEMVIATRPGS